MSNKQTTSKQSTDKQKDKQAAKGAYAEFLRGLGGQDFTQHVEALEKSLVLQGIRAETTDEKAASINKIEGVILVRDYILRMAQKTKVTE